MINIKQAAQAASDFMVGLYSDKGISDIRLEEVELSEDQCWLITLSFSSPTGSALDGLLARRRHYKVVKVDRNTGEVLSMKIRELAHEAA
jgi:hypothetical protein